MMYRLTLDQEKQLIVFFRDNPSLWNTKDKEYNNRTLRGNKLEQIARQLGLTRKDVYEKYRNLRTTFFREHKRVTRLAASRSLDSNGTPTQRYVSRWRHYNNMLFLTNTHNDNNPSGSNLILSNDDSTSIPNGHEVDLLNINNNGQNQNLSGSSDEVIMLSDGDHSSSLMSNNVGILANNHNSQRVYQNNNSTSTNNSSITISTLPVSSLSVIHAPTSTANNNLTSTPINNSKLKFNSQNSNIQQNQPQTFLIKNSSSGNGTSTPTIIVSSSGSNVTNSTRNRHQSYYGTISDSVNSATQIVPLQQSALSQTKKGQSLIVMTSVPQNKDQHPVQHPVSTSFDSFQPQVRSLLITPDINVFSDNSINNHGESSSGNSSLLTNNSNNSNQYLRNRQAENELFDWIKSVVQDSLAEYDDEEMSFCRSLAAPLRSLDRTKKDIVKLELQQVIVRHTNPNYLGYNSSLGPNNLYTNNEQSTTIGTSSNAVSTIMATRSANTESESKTNYNHNHANNNHRMNNHSINNNNGTNENSCKNNKNVNLINLKTDNHDDKENDEL